MNNDDFIYALAQECIKKFSDAWANIYIYIYITFKFFFHRIQTQKDKDKFDKDNPPMVYACATKWHESRLEMKQLLKSLFRYYKFN